ncbi:hypothetical protein DAMA08_002890 [Martiniozyma asiatica (nom. inval.)]|nr:hypothetical protein DAMA08_002890 [Martiniozyma asiatica]
METDQSKTVSFSYIKVVFVLILFIVSLVSFVSQTELTSILYSEYGFDEPIFLLFLTHGFWWLLWPIQCTFIASYKAISKLSKRRWTHSFIRSIKAQHQNIYHTCELTTKYNNSGYTMLYPNPKFSFDELSLFLHSEALRYMFITCLKLSVVLNVAGITWYIAMSLSTGADVTAIYNCSAFTAYLFAIPLLGDRLTPLKAGAVVIAIFGVFIVAYSGPPNDGEYPYRTLGNFIILIGAILYGLYEVLYKCWACPPSNEISARRQATFSNFTMCLMGISSLFLMGIPMAFIHITGIYRFNVSLTFKGWSILLGSILSNHIFSVSFLGLMGLTDPVFSSVASLLTILVVGLWEWFVRGVTITFTQILGYIGITVGFLIIGYISWNEISEENEEDDGIDTDIESTYSSL